MSTVRAANGILMARCSKCDHDLVVHQSKKAKKAWNFCSNPGCTFHKKAHKTGPELNEGKQI